MKSSLTFIPTISIHPFQINSYNQIHWDPFKPNPKYVAQHINKIEPSYGHLLKSARSAQGHVSQIAKRKIKKAFSYLLFLSRPKTVQSRFSGKMFTFRIAFVTLTLPSKQIHDDNIIKSKCLNSLLIELTKYYNVKNYVWRAEKQQNGNLHFHLLVDKFIDCNELRNRWNRIVNKLGYVERYRDEMRKFHRGGFKVREKLLRTWSYKKQLKAYRAGIANDWNSPNSSDIHGLRKIRDLKSYLSKYLTKNDYSVLILQVELQILKVNELIKKKQGILKRKYKRQLLRLKIKKYSLKAKIQKGRIWGCNQNLSNCKGAVVEVDSRVQEEIENILKTSQCEQYHSSYFSVFSIDFQLLSKYSESYIFRKICDYLFHKFGYSFQSDLF